MADDNLKTKSKSISEWKSKLFPNTDSINRPNQTKNNPTEIAVLLANRAVENLKQQHK